MSGPNCFTPLLACRLRIALLDDTGAPDPGADALWVTDALIRVQYQLVVSEGTTIEVKNGCGNFCARRRSEDTITGVNVTLELCQLDIEGIGLATGGSVVTEGGRGNVGLAIPAVDSQLTRRVSVEVWSLAWDGDEQATEGGDALHWRTIFPSVSFREGDRTYEEGATTIPLVGEGRGNSNFGNGPGNDLPWGAYTSPKGEYLDAGDLPAATCGTTTLVAS